MWQLCLLTILYFGFLLVKIMLSCLYLFHFLILSFLTAHPCWIIQASLNPLSHFHYYSISRIFFLKLWPSFLWCFHFFLPLFLQLLTTHVLFLFLILLYHFQLFMSLFSNCLYLWFVLMFYSLLNFFYIHGKILGRFHLHAYIFCWIRFTSHLTHFFLPFPFYFFV